ncbi:unnamed protein product [Alopecurus aequalis]
MALLRDSMVLLLASIMVIAMVLSPSCHALIEECNPIIPCIKETCFVHCQQLGYKNPGLRDQVHCECKPGEIAHEICCCGWVGYKNLDVRRLLSQ